MARQNMKRNLDEKNNNNREGHRNVGISLKDHTSSMNSTETNQWLLRQLLEMKDDETWQKFDQLMETNVASTGLTVRESLGALLVKDLFATKKGGAEENSEPATDTTSALSPEGSFGKSLPGSLKLIRATSNSPVSTSDFHTSEEEKVEQATDRSPMEDDPANGVSEGDYAPPVKTIYIRTNSLRGLQYDDSGRSIFFMESELLEL
jgi:hypothetical protein